MKFYLVGGAVRDSLLNLKVKDRDWVVVGGSKEALLEQNFIQVGKGFPVFLHPESGEEYALARTETKTGPGHTGFDFDASAAVTLEEDLGRRDLTINALAQSEDGELIDPYQGYADLENRILRHVSPAFSEDPLRVLRAARFAARLAKLEFKIADETLQLMTGMTTSGELDQLVKERVWQEINLALNTESPSVFFSVLRDCGALQVVLPEVDNLFGVPQPAKYHPEIDTGIHTLMCLQQIVRLGGDSVSRYATLVHDVGKAVTDKSKWPSHIQHEVLGLELQDNIVRRLKVPNDHAEIARLVCEHHTKLHRLMELRASTVLSLLETLDAFRRPKRLMQFLQACEADARGRTGLEDQPYPQRELLLKFHQAAEEIDTQSLVARWKESLPEGEASGKKQSAKIGELIRRQRLQAIQAEKDRLLS